MRQVDNVADIFGIHRARLLRIAYGMLGSRGEAEDVVQNALLRWVVTDRAGRCSPASGVRLPIQSAALLLGTYPATPQPCLRK